MSEGTSRRTLEVAVGFGEDKTWFKSIECAESHEPKGYIDCATRSLRELSQVLDEATAQVGDGHHSEHTENVKREFERVRELHKGGKRTDALAAAIQCGINLQVLAIESHLDGKREERFDTLDDDGCRSNNEPSEKENFAGMLAILQRRALLFKALQNEGLERTEASKEAGRRLNVSEKTIRKAEEDYATLRNILS